MKKFTAILHKEEEMYVAECPEVGTVSQGETIKEAMSNLKEATELYLEEFPPNYLENPVMKTFEVDFHAAAKKSIRA
jgi:predicted RNase H-like HicB family nuclease